MFRHLARLAKSDRLIAILDQGLLATARFATVLLLARVFQVDQFAILALVIAISYIAVGLNRALVVLPFVLECNSQSALEAKGKDWLSACLATCVFVLAVCTAIGLVTVQTVDHGWIGSALLVSALVAPLAILYEFVRRFTIQSQDTISNLYQVLAFNVLTLTLLVLIWWSKRFDVAVASMAVPYLLAAILGLWRLPFLHFRPSFKGALEAWKRHVKMCAWGAGEFLADLALGYGLIAIVAVKLGTTGNAIYSATRNIAAPIYAVTSALGTVEMPRFSRALHAGGRPALDRAFKSSLVLHLAMVSVIAISAYLLADVALHAAYKGKFDGNRSVMLLWLAAACTFAMCKPFEAFLLTNRRPHVLFWCKCAASLVAVIFAIFLLAPYGLAGVLAGMVSGLVLNLSLLVFSKFYFLSSSS